MANQFKDFIGNPITPGCFVAYPGGGNTKAEYGLILYKVLELLHEKKKLKVVRIHTDYAQLWNETEKVQDGFHPSHLKNALVTECTVPDHYHRNEGAEIRCKIAVRFTQATIESTNKLAVVTPSELIRTVFEKVLARDASVFEQVTGKQFANWQHGGISYINNFERP